MSYPTPNGPTIADLQYNAFNPGGSINTTSFVPPLNSSISDSVLTQENVVLNFVGYIATDYESDVLTTTENIAVSIDTAGPNRVVVTTSDSITTSESMDILKAGARNVTVSDTIVSSENISVVII